jgi:thymidylate kinase
MKVTAVDFLPTIDQVLPNDLLRRESTSLLSLVQDLCNTLAIENINYCHWKSNDVIERSGSGENDLDLLVSRADVTRFTEILYRMGFKQAKAAPEREMPGVLDYYAYDEEADKLIHVHAHYQLILGNDMTKNYRLPIEKPYLESSVQGDLFRIPAPDFEFIVFVIRMVLKHLTWDSILARQGTLKKAERQELRYLQDRIDQDRVNDILKQHLPYVGVTLFDDCIRALQPGSGIWSRVKIGQRLQAALQANVRRRMPSDVYLKLWRRATLVVRRRVFKYSPKYRLASGGALIAIVGGDGAGKSTAVDALNAWLSKYFVTTQVHMGKPTWSWTTKTVRGILKIGNLLHLIPIDSSFQKTLNQKSPVSPGYPWLLREVCRARDRYKTYLKARRFAANGGLVIVDRFPVHQIKLMDGPQARRFVSQLSDGTQANLLLSPRQGSRLAQRLVNLEESYYHQITSPELLFALLVNPEIAVQRRADEDADTVRQRSTEIWTLNWEQTAARVVDSSKSKEEVLTELKALIWSAL